MEVERGGTNMGKSILKRLEALENVNTSKKDLEYVEEVLRLVRVAVENYKHTRSDGILSIELPKAIT
jgi:hypothetical protein